MLIQRLIEPHIKNGKKSVLLIGPRQTGKSTLIQGLKPDLVINLMHELTFLQFSRNPKELEELLSEQQPKTVFIDEIQRLPSLFNTLQVMIDKKQKTKFYLTGSSARKLRRGEANLLPGRLYSNRMTPLVSGELDYRINAKEAMQTGLLPGIFTARTQNEKEKTLKHYSGIYLQEEIRAEALTKNIEGFSRFLEVAATHFAQFLDLSKLSKEAMIPRQTASRYFEILEDTLIVIRCPAFSKTERKRFIQHPKYYFFDCGVLNAVLGNFKCSQDRIGPLFENLFFSQMIHSAHAKDLDVRISSWRTSHGLEVDFIVERGSKTWVVEVKSNTVAHKSHLSGLKGFANFYKKKHYPLLAYLGEARKKIAGVPVLPWQDALKEMGL